MANTQNAGDLQLASTSPRMDTIPTPNIIVDFANVIGTTKPADNATKNIITYGTLSARPIGSNGDIYYITDTIPPIESKKIDGSWISTATNNVGSFATLIGNITSSNYPNYLSDGCVSIRAFAQNVGAPASIQIVSLVVAPDTRDVIIDVGAVIIGATAGGGNTHGLLYIKENDTYFVDTRVVANFPNSDLVRPAQVCINHSVFRSSAVPSGSTTYTVGFSAEPNPVGSYGQLVQWTYIKVLVLKR